MGDRHDYVALDWVKGEIEEVLKQAQYELEAYVESPDDTARMRFCLTYLHQVRGTLQMVEFYGAALLAEEMEAVAQAMLDEKVHHPAEAREILMQAILQLPNYLDHVKLGRRDLPVVLLPVLNDLRSARGESLLSETSLFQPTIDVSQPLTSLQKVKFEDPQFIALIRKLRQMYQVALLGVLKGKDIPQNLDYLQKVNNRLAQTLHETPVGALWSVAAAVMEGLQHKSIALNSAIKELLKQLEPELKKVATQGLDGLSGAPEDLLKNLLFYVAKSSGTTARVSQVKQQFNLAQALPATSEVDKERRALSGPDKATMGSVAAALIEEITHLKEHLDTLVRDKGADSGQLSELLPAFKQISDTMAMLGLGTPRKVIQDQFDLIKHYVSKEKTATNTELMDVAGALLYVEASLSGLSDRFGGEDSLAPEQAQLGEAQHAVLRESKQLIENVKDLVVEFAIKAGDLALLTQAGEQLNNLASTLTMVPQPQAALIAEGCAQLLNDLVERGERPDLPVLENLAEALSGIEYFLERLDDDDRDNHLDILEKARKALAHYITLDDLDITPPVEQPVVANASIEDEPALLDSETELVDEPEADADDSEDIELDLSNEFAAGEVSDEASETESMSAASHAPLDELASVLDAPEATLEVEAKPELKVEDDDDDLIDDEIIEIFLEEAEEVLATINEYWPQFKLDQSNEEALTTTRRAFHTLKGSGRMVSAEDIGETAWAIENLFNRIIDTTIQLSPEFFGIVDYVTQNIQGLISAFKDRAPCPIEVKAVQEYANRLAHGEPVEAWPSSPATVQPQAAANDVSVDDSKEADDQSIDPALLEVFSSEVASHLAAIQSYIDEAQSDNYETPLSDGLQRALHTLKGSAHMAHIEAIADIAAPLENFVKDLRAYHIPTSAEIVHLFMRGKELIDSGFHQLTDNPFASIAGTSDLIADINRLTKQLIEDAQTEMGATAGKEIDPQVLSVFLAEGMDILLDAESILERWQDNPGATELLDAVLGELKTLEKGADMAELAPVVELCAALEAAYQKVMAQGIQPTDAYVDVIRDAHEGLLNMMDMVAAGQALLPDHELVAALSGQSLPHESSDSDVDEIHLPQEDLELTDLMSAESLKSVDDQPEATASVAPAPEENANVANISAVEPPAYSADIEDIEVDQELMEIFLEEAQELLESIGESLHAWQQDKDNLLQVAELQRDLHTFKGGARMAEINPVGDLAHELEDLYEGINLGRLKATTELFDLLHLCHDRLADMVHALAEHQPVKSAPELIVAIQKFIAGESIDVAAYSSHADATVTQDSVTDLELNAGDDRTSVEPETDNTFEILPAADEPESVAIMDIAGEADEEVIEIFLDEADELLEGLDISLQSWQLAPSAGEHNEAIQRLLHTFKGGARIAGLVELGDLSHDMETDLQQLQIKAIDPDAGIFKKLHQQYDLIASRIDSIRLWFNNGAQGPVFISDAPAPERVVSDDELERSPQEATGDTPESGPDAPTPQTLEEFVTEAHNVVPLRPITEAKTDHLDNLPVSKTEAATQMTAQQGDSPARRAQPQEMIKVPAELLDGLVNLAGETSISRGRLESQVNDFGFTLEEMDSTLERLKDQLRRLDMETEAQVLFRQERQGPNYDDFDPLEMDRYSQLQQLSRSLVESASDLMDLKSTLLDKTRDAETLLLQQSRVNTELQEGLMKTRMVPFARLVPRLRRIVRQVGQELGKQVELKVTNAEGEMDRTVLERLISPLEHMLRNAVDHGLETTEERLKAGKTETGTVSLSLSRDGGDVILRLADDGAGINLKAVRQKAIERGLMDAKSDLPDQEILQFILQAGFSTAEKVTQISGRGVGMDVVNSEIKQVGGTVTIDSVEGQGTEFLISLPFTVSVNRALMAKVGDALFAIPLNSIEGIVRVSPYSLDELYQMENPVYSYAGRDYQMNYLGNLLRDDSAPKLTGQNMPLPVVLVRGSQPAALQVDSLMGSREIVVKTLGPQFTSVVGVSGGTILGDGNVVIILDLPNLMRHVNSLEYKQHMVIEQQEEAALEQRSQVEDITRVLVVDDSVTVRKVTTRLLERNGMEVRTAKDGVDAMTTLQEYQPDIVLLDIEMPRMDGFEVATQMRHNTELVNIPIIMITSRTGDKHKERAMAIGVTEYMGKPFQEDKLMATIREITGRAQ